MSAPRIRLSDVEAFARWTPFVRPFRFGAVTVEGAFQAFVSVVVEVEGHGRATGMTAELMPPKWFDKRPGRSPGDTVRDLVASLSEAVARANAIRTSDTAFGHHAALHERQIAWARAADVTPLSAAFGVAQVDKAVLDGLSKALGRSFVAVLAGNAAGIDTRLTPDLAQAAVEARLAALSPARSIALRHTVGLMDQIDGPDSLAGELDAADLRFFKIKLGGDPATDCRRLAKIAGLLDGRGIDYRVTVDANEQYAPDALADLLIRADAEPRLAGLMARLLFIEQPYDRRVTFEQGLNAGVAARGVIIDEADDAYDAFPRARALGYSGVSSKCCKGFYKALLNATRAAVWNEEAGEGRFLVSAEDLTCQPGLAVQQDTAFVAALGLTHVERNGHHYVDGFGPAPETEAQAFRAAHPGLYAATDRVRLAVASGRLDLSSLDWPGFASGAMPDLSSLQPLSIVFAEGQPA
ncbi:enolase [Phreatobacter cathodiphilus]|uniref:Enolase n=1 Tax=Phreatobacter cathodiphilus TaxID=1868589 RepID=A0A2S0NCH4_9HYPH|nr:enolase [Phreatobacter cathodiphilus]AVO45845.1 enolase [Phreatobacter cathodiphilus]